MRGILRRERHRGGREELIQQWPLILRVDPGGCFVFGNIPGGTIQITACSALNWLRHGCFRFFLE